MKPDLRQALSQQILIGDGAMGTYLYHLGFPVGISYEELNLTKPDVIGDVHKRYYDAGARVIETNTYSANRDKLSKFGLEQEVEAINRAGVDIARKAVGEDAYVVGAVGSIRGGRRNNAQLTEVEADLREQIGALISAGADGILLETFFDVEEMLLALGIVRELGGAKVPVICQFATEDVGRTLDGYTMEEAFKACREQGADVVGFNCRTGPNGILRALEGVVGHVSSPFSVYPNAGIPDYVDDKYTYMATPEYFADSALKFAAAGARLIGGCCGTTPEHIRAMADALRGFAPHSPRTAARPAATPAAAAQPAAAAPDSGAPAEASAAAPNILELVRQRHTVIVELDPPRDLDIARFMQGSAALQEAGADAVTMADNSLAVTRMSNLALGALVQQQTGLRPLIHIACRDRNLIGTQSHMMGLHALGIDHVLAVTGDPASFGDLPGSSNVYDVKSFEIIRMIKQLNEGIAFSGKELKQKASFVVGAAFNPNVKHLDKAVQRLERKVEAGADYIMTQPVYDIGLIERIYQSTKHLDIPIFIGIMPLASGRNAEFLHNEVPGIQLSPEIRERMAGLEGEVGRRVGVEIGKELLDAAMQYFNGIYLITPFLFYGMTAELTRYVWEKTKRHDFDLYPLSK
ncbi:homocysteine methyltransferase [Paenibacillus swuensis]|uniref:Homocysteine methyltransferase n=1 Tax=Paenibacillus swuensis TaxID=1178515 RepID=A0A172TKG9_9BACL|nr:bifunctional homocysteine S-methyltransferase/methylenetetrahydrofolate reductase [Paenibacillus swuensis]ANE47472.1 homocysteine methyltransferase [Paenibacillus swuensis]